MEKETLRLTPVSTPTSPAGTQRRTYTPSPEAKKRLAQVTLVPVNDESDTGGEAHSVHPTSPHPSMPSPSPVSAPSPVSSEDDEWGEVNSDDTPLGVVTPLSPSSPVTTEVPVTPTPVSSEDDEWGSVNDDDTMLGEPVSAPSPFSHKLSDDVPDWDESPEVPSSEAVNIEPARRRWTPVSEAKVDTPPTPADGDDWGAVNDSEVLIGGYEYEEEEEAPEVPLSVTKRLNNAEYDEQPRKKEAKRGSRVRPRSAYKRKLVLADRIVLRALVQMRWASKEHLRQYIINSGNTNIVNISDSSLSERLRKLGRNDAKAKPLIMSRQYSDSVGNAANIYTPTALGIETSGSIADGYLDVLNIYADKKDTTTAHYAIGAAWIAEKGAGFLAVPDSVMQSSIASYMELARTASSTTSFRPEWNKEMHPFEEAAELSILAPREVTTPHRPDIAMLKIEKGEDGSIHYAYHHAVEVEVSIKSPDRLDAIIRNYMEARIPVQYLISNSLPPGTPPEASPDTPTPEAVYNAVARAASRVWGVPENEVNTTSGFRMSLVPESWKGAKPYSTEHHFKG